MNHGVPPPSATPRGKPSTEPAGACAREEAGRAPLHCWRGDVLTVEAPGRYRIMLDHVLEVDASGRIAAIRPARPGERIEHDHRGCLIAPGFVDAHVHFSQLDVIGSPAAGLLEWLERHTFPAEARFSDPAHAAIIAEIFLDELLRHGVTTASVFCTSHTASVDAFMAASRERGLAMIAGKVLQDRHSPEAIRDDTEQSLRDSETLIARWHGCDRLLYALTPRFAPTSTERQLFGAAELVRAHPGVRIQSHLAENIDEIKWVRELFPSDRSYLGVYERIGLLTPQSVWAHCIHLDDRDRAVMRERGAIAAVCPTSNLFLGSGLFDFAKTPQAWALASDVGGGSSFSPFRTMLAAYEIARLQGQHLSPSTLWWHASTGSAQALGLGDDIGTLNPGRFADFIVLQPRATPLLERRWASSRNDDERLFSLIVLADDRHIAETVVAGRIAHRSGAHRMPAR